MNVDQKKIDRLMELSQRNAYNAYTRFDWPETVDVDSLWCDEDLLTTFGTPVHDMLSEQQRFELSKWEAINFFSLNVHGIKTVLEFVCRCFYRRRYEDISKYLHVFLAEENAHMWFFARFCQQYGSKIYPAVNLPLPNGSDDLETDFYMFASTLIFEEFVDYYNRKVGKNDAVAHIVREINHQHHQDEARHVSFGREIVKDLYASLDPDDDEQRARIDRTVKGIFGYFIGLMYNPAAYEDAGVVEAAGSPNAAALRNRLRNAEERRSRHCVWFRNTASYFEKIGAVNDTAFLAVH